MMMMMMMIIIIIIIIIQTISHFSVTLQWLLDNISQYISDDFKQWEQVCVLRSLAWISVMYS